jgi:hypothetical protein
VFSSHAACGLRLEFADFTAQKSFMQLHEAVRLGASFATAKPAALSRPPAGLIAEHFAAGPDARLVAWREAAGRSIDSFELVIGDHCLRGEAQGPTLEAYARQAGRDSGKVARSAAAYKLSAGLDAEVRQLFRWVVPNLGKAVPADLRGFMQRVIGEAPAVAGRNSAASFPPPRRPATRPPLPSTPPAPPGFGKPGPKPGPGVKQPS